jgi:hypothetical protein
MKKTLIYVVMLILTTSVFILSSCKKEDDPVTPATDFKALLQDKKWKLIKQEVNGVDFFFQLDKCSQDDLRIYNANGTVTQDEGVTKCISTDPQQSSDGTWTLSTDGKSLTYKDSFNDTYIQTVTELSASTLKIEYKELGATWAETYSKQ